MSQAKYIVFMSMIVFIYAINRPVYKIVLKQKGYTQFLQYDVITPPLSEFTFCTWIRVYDLAKDQTIFAYVVNGNNRVMRLWLDSGGRQMRVSIDDNTASSMAVEVVKDVWRHVCLSYQSDYGAWALYIDSRLVSCEAASSLRGFVMPGGGSVIIGYGTGVNGDQNGFEGEIFGANMILSSTIERNYSNRIDPKHEQKRFPRNKLKDDSKYNDYVVLSDLLNEKIQNNFEYTNMPHEFLTRNYHDDKASEEERSVVINDKPIKKYKTTTTLPDDDFDFTISDFTSTNQKKMDFFNTKGHPRFTFAELYKSEVTSPGIAKLLGSATKVVSTTVSEYETPPPPPPNFYSYKTEEKNKRTSQSIYGLSNTTKSGTNIYNKIPTTELFDFEIPPPIDKNTKVYGQWTSSKFAGLVLNYLKSNNFKHKDQIIKRVPQTIPLQKLSDSHPYPSELKLNILRPPSHFRNRKVVQKRYDIVRRDPKINSHVLEDDLRLNIIKMHAETQPKKVEIKSRGSSKKRKELRFYRDTQYYETKSNSNIDNLEENQPKPFILKEKTKNNHRYFVHPTTSNTRTSKLPFFRTLEYLTEEHENSEIPADNNNDPNKYYKKISQGNKWHNAKSYSNDYTPHKITMDDDDILDYQRKLYPTLKLRYAPSKPKKKYVKEDTESSIMHARKLAAEVSNQSIVPQDIVSILKYSYGNLREHNEISKLKLNNKVDVDIKRMPTKRNMKARNFDHHVKIGNALNERTVIGSNDEQKKRSFVGGDENIPDINKFRSDIDNGNAKVPPSLGHRACKNVELYDRVLYVQPDESIDLSHILSPFREKNAAIEFIMQNYKKCSLADSSFQNNALLLIDWSKTPVRLFGGAYPRTTTDLCGFF